MQAGLRQEDIAARIQRPQSFVSKYESGERSIDVIEMVGIVRAIGATVQELLAALGAEPTVMAVREGLPELTPVEDISKGKPGRE